MTTEQTMLPDNPADILIRLLETHEAGQRLLNTVGDVMLSGWNTIQPGPIYLLGYNPGGDTKGENEKDIRTSLLNTCHGPYSAYADETWGNKEKKGSHHHQRRVRCYLQRLGLNAEQVPASNLLFAKSKTINELKSARQQSELHALIEASWLVHNLLLTWIRPRLILCLGNGNQNSAYAWLRNLHGKHSDSLQKIWSKDNDVIKHFECTHLYGDTPHGHTLVVGVRHPSRFKISSAGLKYLEELARDAGLDPATENHCLQAAVETSHQSYP